MRPVLALIDPGTRELRVFYPDSEGITYERDHTTDKVTCSLRLDPARGEVYVTGGTVLSTKLDLLGEGDAATVSLDALHTAWENAERAGECREDDVLIRRDDYGGYEVYPASSSGAIWTARILSRAPQREPWADLADDLAEVLDVDARRSEELARDLHNGGWRKGGDEK